jgi:hypothetical protein
LKEWNIPREAVTLVAAGGSGVRLAAMEKKALDATVLPYDHAAMGSKAGLRILADMPTLVPSFPDKVIIMRRSFVQKERDKVKRFLQGLSEAIYEISVSPEKGMSVLSKRLNVKDPKVIEENYNTYGRLFAFPPRVGRKGMDGVLEQIQQQSGGAKSNLGSRGLSMKVSLMSWREKDSFRGLTKNNAPPKSCLKGSSFSAGWTRRDHDRPASAKCRRMQLRSDYVRGESKCENRLDSRGAIDICACRQCRCAIECG